MKHRIYYRLIAFAVVMSMSVSAHSQLSVGLSTPLGVGISSANADLHLHKSTNNEPGVGHEMGMGDEPMSGGGAWASNYTTTFLVTNGNTGTASTDGFVIKQENLDVTLRQQESAPLKILGCNGTGLTIAANGHVGVRTTPSDDYDMVVAGSARVFQSLKVSAGIDAWNMTLADNLTIGGSATIGNGFQCSSDGHVRVKELKVTLNGWSDYVFDADYELMSLGELERYISVNHHLPDIPAADEVIDNGVNVGEMNAALLRKVEELTLYVIDLQKQIEELKK